LSVILSSFVYSTVVSWAWAGDGFLKEMGFVDFAGSCVVHLVGGCAALMGAIMVGPRRNR
jgi:Amt family ammonium transporter